MRLDHRVRATSLRPSLNRTKYDYDSLGRLLHDRVTAFGTNIDQAVKRLSATYDVVGRLESLASHDSATVGMGAVLNEVELVYNTFGQPTSEYQEHEGAKGGSSLRVQYAYVNGSANHTRPTSVTYPDGRVMTLHYGAGGSYFDVLSRISAIKEGATALANYKYLGLGRIVETEYGGPQLRQFETDGSGDPYDTKWDRFDRKVTIAWWDDGASLNPLKTHHGFDRNSNIVYRDDEVAGASGGGRDHLYTYDALDRLVGFERGDLNGTKTEQTAPCIPHASERGDPPLEGVGVKATHFPRGQPHGKGARRGGERGGIIQDE